MLQLPAQREIDGNLPAHPLDLQADGGRCLVLACGIGPVGFLRQNSQRILQSMRQVSGLGQRPADDPFTMFQQGIQVIHQRLHLCRVSAFNPAEGTVTEAQQLPAQAAKGQQSLTQLQDSHQHTEERKNKCRRQIDYASAILMVHHKERNLQQRNKAERPEKSAKEDAPAERVRPLHDAAFMR